MKSYASVPAVSAADLSDLSPTFQSDGSDGPRDRSGGAAAPRLGRWVMAAVTVGAFTFGAVVLRRDELATGRLAPEPRVDFAFPDVHTYTVRVSGAKVQSASFDVSSRVVRQELRQLSDADRDVPERDAHGRATSQDEGESLRVVLQERRLAHPRACYGAAVRRVRPRHDGAGILNHRVGITWQMENSMRLVDSSVAMHYWDYTYDASVYGADWQSSPVFYDSWFGTASPANEHHVVDGGRWAYTQVLSGSKALAFSNLTNPYGLLRSPGTNKTPYLTRSNFTTARPTTPTTPHVLVLRVLAHVLGLGRRHGLRAQRRAPRPVHIMIGGQWDFKEPKWGDLTAQLSFPDAFLLLSKFLWRQGYVRCPATCSWDTEPADCECSCPSTLTGVGVTRSASEFLEFAGVDALNPNSNLELLMDEYGLNDTQYLDALCHDPTFWLLHGNAERYLQYARLLKAEGVLSFSESWGYSHAQELPGDTGIVCDWSGVDPASMELPTCAKETCPGHKGDDLLPFADLMDSQDGLYTNNEFYELVDPTNDDLPYVYDSLSYWPGCTDDTLL
ncbi:hypothetical protein JL721_12338 [Aureococcus anophagefferens]|nr:hypothetical protein JL721_12338 [Aureococcus anophagefferens]